jgi:hypothetical protein
MHLCLSSCYVVGQDRMGTGEVKKDMDFLIEKLEMSSGIFT